MENKKSCNLFLKTGLDLSSDSMDQSIQKSQSWIKFFANIYFFSFVFIFPFVRPREACAMPSNSPNREASKALVITRGNQSVQQVVGVQRTQHVTENQGTHNLYEGLNLNHLGVDNILRKPEETIPLEQFPFDVWTFDPLPLEPFPSVQSVQPCVQQAQNPIVNQGNHVNVTCQPNVLLPSQDFDTETKKKRIEF